MVKNRKFELFKIDKIMKYFLVNSARKFQLLLVVFIATLSGGIFLDNFMPELLPPVQALSLKNSENSVIIQVGDGVKPETRMFRGTVGQNFVITSGNNKGQSDAYYTILLNGENVAQISQALNSRGKQFQVKAGENLYTIVDEKNQIIDEFIIRGIENNK
ncbi:hypothetical protein [Rivularia sp. UHCC 0363]|uniref:hypothetical protein n=1 Tax=Rivularia sp. UHCC 0363 TaxID=3110244 RepID=UPI002B1FF724|nr:hypothetical protein [Rivularia sp. UHCC 0363]MEA5593461.1 hypothetical protein [Rivularia sp. UHCC 0363]